MRFYAPFLYFILPRAILSWRDVCSFLTMWTFLYPLFLWAASAAILPLVLHLMRRRKPVRIPFSTIRFLKLAERRSSSRVRMENLLLWLLRTLLILALVAAFAMPVWRSSGLEHLLGKSHRDIAIVLDVSGSMRYETGSRRVWDSALAAAIGLVRDLDTGDRACVYLAGEHANALVEKPSADLATVSRLLRDAQPGNGVCHLAEATAAALAALRDSRSRERELYLLTDGQALSWHDFGASTNGDTASTNGDTATAGWDPSTVDPGVAVFTLLAGPVLPENTWTADVRVRPDLLMTNTAATLTAHLARTGPAQSVAVALLIDGREVRRRSAVLESGGAATVEFALPPLAAGVHTAAVTVPTDGLPQDDVMHLLLRIREQLPVLCVGAEADTFFLTTALNPDRARAGTIRRIEPDALAAEPLQSYSTVFLVNALPLGGQAILAVEQYVRQGGVLVIFAGDRAAPADYVPWTILPAKPASIADLPAGQRVRTLRLVAERDPLFADFALPPGAVPTLAIQRHLAWPALEPGAVVTVMAGNDVPLLVSRPAGKGRVLLCTVSADRRWSNLPIGSFFLPLVHQMVQYGAGIGREPIFAWVESPLALGPLLPDFAANDRLLDPAGALVSVRPFRNEASTGFQADGLVEPGIYARVPAAGSPLPGLALNLRREESALDPVDPAIVRTVTGFRTVLLSRDGEELQRQVEEHRRGRPLTEAFFWLALVLALWELWLANRTSRVRTPLTQQMHVDATGKVTGSLG